MTAARVLDTQRLATLANAYQPDIVHFLRELAIPAFVWRLRLEMEKLAFEEIRLDAAGSIFGRVGGGKRVILLAAHADAAGTAGMASMIYAGKLIRELGMYDDFTLWAGGLVGPEFSAGNIRPDCVLSTEPTNLRIYPGVLPGGEDAALLDEAHPLVEAAIATYESLFELPPLVGKRAACLTMGVPTVAFGPGEEESPENVPVRQLVKAAQFYAAFPSIFVDALKRG